METTEGVDRPAQWRVVAIGPDDRDLIEEAIALGNQNSKTLGFMPYAGYEQAAGNGTLLAVLVDNAVAAYALYFLPREVIRLTHLCVGKGFRGQGLARALVESISERHGGRSGIILRCRSDYPENEMWPHLGFVKRSTMPGRGRDQRELTVWWLDHGHPDLFSSADSYGPLKIMIDLNVFADLESGYERDEYQESKAIVDVSIAAQIELVVSSELRREISRLPESDERERQLQAVRRYFTVHNDADAISRVADKFTAAVTESGGPDLSARESDVSDVRHLAEAYLAGVSVLVTRDEIFIEWANKIISDTEVRVMRPSDVVLHLDELARAHEYKPAQLEQTRYTLTRISSGAENELVSFLALEQQEKKASYLGSLREVLAHGSRVESGLLRDPKGNPIAFFVARVDNGEFVVPFLRVRSKRLGDTVVRQLLFFLRKRAGERGVNLIRMSDSFLDGTTVLAMREDGFIRHRSSWVGFTIPVCGTAAEVGAQLDIAASLADLNLQQLRPGLSAPIASDLERRLWPAKIVDSDLPNFIVPIRPEWSTDLFGYPQTLMYRPDALGISREHVYYRSPRPNVEIAPARILWYVSGADRVDGVTAVVACSRLDEVVVAKPEELHQRFRHLGVWKRAHVVGAAKEGRARALRFSDTEIFPTPVSLRRLRVLSDRFRTVLTLQSAQKISPDLFAAIYHEGRYRDERR